MNKVFSFYDNRGTFKCLTCIAHGNICEVNKSDACEKFLKNLHNNYVKKDEIKSLPST